MIDANRVLAEVRHTRFSDVRVFDQLDSTNTYLVAEARAGAPDGVVVVADYQRAGRGRLDRRWESPPGGGLLTSVLFRPQDLPVERWHLLSLSVALAAADACWLAAGVRAQLKWPNDLLVGEAKLAGVLAEAVDGGAVVGIGLNVYSAPPGATSLAAASARRVERGDLLVILLQRLDALVGRWEEVTRRADHECVTVGRRVRVDLGGGRVLEGKAQALGPDGGLVVAAQGGGRLVTVRAGDVVHVTGCSKTIGGSAR